MAVNKVHQWLDPLQQSLAVEDTHTLLRGGRQAYRLSFGLTAILGAVLGLVGLGQRPLDLQSPGIVAALLIVGAALAGLMFWLVYQGLSRELLQASRPQARRTAFLAAGFGLSVAPAIPWLLACAALVYPLPALLLVGLSAVIYLLGWRQLAGWVKLV